MDQFSGSRSAVNSLTGQGWYSEYTTTTWDDYLDNALAKGWFASGPMSWPGKDNDHLIDSTMSTVTSYISATKDHAALLAWFWDDEPDLYQDNAPGARYLTELTHQYDTEHPVWINFVGYQYTHDDQGWANNRAREYCYLYNESIFGRKTMIADIVGIDYYPHEYSTAFSFCNLSDYLLALDRLRDWNYGLVPTATFIQPCDEARPGSSRLGTRTWSPPPNEAQVKNLIWLSFIHGVKVMSYFQYFEWFNTTPRPNLSPMQESLEWLEDLASVILSAPEDVATNVSVTVPSGYRVDFMTRLGENDDLYIFSGEVRDWGSDPIYYWPDPNDPTTAYFNIPTGSFTARFDVDGLADDTVITVYGENRTITSEAGYFEDTFDVHDVHIYVIGGN